MTSTASKPKSYVGLAFKKTFKSRLVNMILAICVSVLPAVIAIFSTVDDYIRGNSGYTHTFYGKVDMSDTLLVIISAVTVIAGFFSLSIASKMFSQIYKKQSCDAYFSTPVKREEYFVANYIYGAIVNVLCFVVPTVIFCLALSLISTKSVSFTFNFPVIIPLVIALMLAVLAIYSAFVMCAVISGKRVQYIFLSLICLICPSSMLSGVAVKLNSIWGLSVKTLFVGAVSPVENAMSSVMNFVNNDKIWINILISVIEIAGMFAAGYIAFKRRKAECAEGALSGEVVPYIILSVLAGAAYYYSGTGSMIIDMIIGIVLAVLITMAFTAIFYKKAFTKQTGITAACVCGICAVISIGSILPIFNSYVKYVPELDKVESVEFSSLDSFSEYSGLLSLVDSDISEFSTNNAVKFTDKDDIEKVINLHNVSVQDNIIKASKNQSSSLFRMMLFLDSAFDEDYSMAVDYKLTYKLTDGRVVTRTYSVPNKFIIDPYFNIIQTEEAINKTFPFNIDKSRLLLVTSIRMDQKDIEDASNNTNNEDDFDYWDIDYDYVDIDLKNFDFDKFKEASMKDYLAMPQNEFMDTIDAYNSTRFDYESYSSDYYIKNPETMDITLYYTVEDITPQQLEALNKLTDTQLINKIDSWDDNDLGATCCTISVRANEKNAIAYLNSCGAGIKVK